MCRHFSSGGGFPVYNNPRPTSGCQVNDDNGFKKYTLDVSEACTNIMSGHQLGARWTWRPAWTSCFSRSKSCFLFPGPTTICSRSSYCFVAGPTRRGSLQLWQFLVTLLDDPTNTGAISWTGRGMEFKLIEPEEVKSQ